MQGACKADRQQVTLVDWQDGVMGGDLVASPSIPDVAPEPTMLYDSKPAN